MNKVKDFNYAERIYVSCFKDATSIAECLIFLKTVQTHINDYVTTTEKDNINMLFEIISNPKFTHSIKTLDFEFSNYSTRVIELCKLSFLTDSDYKKFAQKILVETNEIIVIFCKSLALKEKMLYSNICTDFSYLYSLFLCNIDMFEEKELDLFLQCFSQYLLEFKEYLNNFDISNNCYKYTDILFHALPDYRLNSFINKKIMTSYAINKYNCFFIEEIPKIILRISQGQ